MAQHTKPSNISEIAKKNKLGKLKQGNHSQASDSKFTLGRKELDKIFSDTAKYLRNNKPVVNRQIPKKPADYAVNDLLAKYGFQSSQDVLTFLNTTIGKRIQSMVIAKYYNELQRKEEIQQQLMANHLHRRNIMLGFFLLGLLYNKAHAEELRERNTERISKQTLKESLPKPSKVKDTIAEDRLYATNAYAISETTLRDALYAAIKEAKVLQDQIALLAKQEIDLEKRHQIFNAAVNDLDNDIADVEQNISGTDGQIIALGEKSNLLDTKLEKRQNKINNLLAAGKDAEAQIKIHKQHAQQLRRHGLKDMIAILQGKQVLYNADGKPATNFKDAAFILSKEQKIVKDNDGKYYLLKSGQDFNSLTIAEKHLAHQNFDKERQNITTVKKRVVYNQNLENAQHERNCEEVAAKSIRQQDEILHLNNQLSYLQAAQTAPQPTQTAQIKEITQATPNLTQLPATSNIPRLTPTHTSSTLLPVQAKNKTTTKSHATFNSTKLTSKSSACLLGLMHMEATEQTKHGELNVHAIINRQGLLAKMAQSTAISSTPILDQKLRSNLLRAENANIALDEASIEAKYQTPFKTKPTISQ